MISKKEIIWREILYQSLEKKVYKFIQKDLAEKFSLSVSTVFNALKVPRENKTIEVTGRDFRIRDTKKLLFIWATFRRLQKDVIFSGFVKLSVQEIENSLPPETTFGAYSAFIKRFDEVPADYDKIYVYLPKKSIPKIKKRFSFKKGTPNLFILEPDPFLKKYGNLTTLGQTFADLWNLPEWFAADFSKSLEEKIETILA